MPTPGLPAVNSILPVPGKILKLVTLSSHSPLIQSAVYMATEAQKAALWLFGEDFYVAAGVYAVARRGVVGKVCHAEHVVFDIHVCAL